MAGVKGMKGGGGARPGSGPKPPPVTKSKSKAYQTEDPDEFLRKVMSDSNQPFRDRMAAALALKKTGKGASAPAGKKEQQQQAAEDVVRNPLAPQPPPTRARVQLRAVK